MTVTCQNPQCGKSFAVPPPPREPQRFSEKASRPPQTVSAACPYCNTRFDVTYRG